MQVGQIVKLNKRAGFYGYSYNHQPVEVYNFYSVTKVTATQATARNLSSLAEIRFIIATGKVVGSSSYTHVQLSNEEELNAHNETVRIISEFRQLRNKLSQYKWIDAHKVDLPLDDMKKLLHTIESFNVQCN